MTEAQFDNGYWFATEIKAFAKELGIPNSSRLRKDELENLIRHFIKTGKIRKSERKNVVKTGIRDLDRGLTLSLTVSHYTSNRETKDFIKAEALKREPGLKIRSGVWYRLNRWRDEQFTLQKRIAYRDLVNKFIELNLAEGKFEKIAVGRYINFLSDYLANEPGATRTQAIAQWKALKKLDIEKTYIAWKKRQQKR